MCLTRLANEFSMHAARESLQGSQKHLGCHSANSYKVCIWAKTAKPNSRIPLSDSCVLNETTREQLHSQRPPWAPPST